TVTCQQVKNAAAQLLGVCGPVTAPTCGVGIQGIDVVAKSPCLNSTDRVACAQATAQPPAIVPPQDDPGTIVPTTQLTGSIVLGGSAEYPDSQPPTLLLMPAGQTDLSTTPAVDLTAADPTSPDVDPAINYEPDTTSLVPTFAGVPTGADPFIVSGVDYRQALP